MQTERNPRDVITPSAFAVAPELLGLALARPWRRAAAILLDLALCGLIVAIWQARSVFFSALAAFLVYRITSRARPGAGCLMRVLGVSLRGTLALATFVICLASLSAIQFEPRGNNVSMDPATGAAAIEMPALSAGLTLAETRRPCSERRRPRRQRRSPHEFVTASPRMDSPPPKPASSGMPSPRPTTTERG